MTIRNVRYTPYRVPFLQSFTTAHGTLTTRTGAIVEVSTANGISGIGEIAPLPGFSSETLREALAPLPALIARLHGKQLTDALQTLSRAASELAASLVYGLETALLDALSKQQRCPLATLLSGDAGNVPQTASVSLPVNAVIGSRTIEDAVNSAQLAVAAGFTCLKLKMGTGLYEEIERATAVRVAIGPTIQLRLDANEGWSYEQALTILSHCAALAIEYVEQPLPANDLNGMCRLRRAVSIPIAADEALSNLESARRVLAAEAADMFIIKPQLAGGLLTAQQMMQEAARQGIQSVVTSTLETGIGVVSALHLAGANRITLACGLATLPLLLDDLLLDDLPIHNGTIELPTSSGLGVQLDRAALQNYEMGEVPSEFC